MNIHELYEKSADFHGHRCPGLAIGVRAGCEALRLLEAEFSKDEELVCITENDACGVDGLQIVLGCTPAKGNLIFRMRGKHVYTVFNRSTGNGIRLVSKNLRKMEDRSEKLEYILTAPVEDIFEIQKPKISVPKKASIFNSADCEICGESTAEPYIRILEGKKVCIDCFELYSTLPIE